MDASDTELLPHDSPPSISQALQRSRSHSRCLIFLIYAIAIQLLILSVVLVVVVVLAATKGGPVDDIHGMRGMMSTVNDTTSYMVGKLRLISDKMKSLSDDMRSLSSKIQSVNGNIRNMTATVTLANTEMKNITSSLSTINHSLDLTYAKMDQMKNTVEVGNTWIRMTALLTQRIVTNTFIVCQRAMSPLETPKKGTCQASLTMDDKWSHALPATAATSPMAYAALSADNKAHP